MAKEHSSFLSRITGQLQKFIATVVGGLILVWMLVKWIAEHIASILVAVAVFTFLAALVGFFFRAVYIYFFKAPSSEKKRWNHYFLHHWFYLMLADAATVVVIQATGWTGDGTLPIELVYLLALYLPPLSFALCAIVLSLVRPGKVASMRAYTPRRQWHADELGNRVPGFRQSWLILYSRFDGDTDMERPRGEEDLRRAFETDIQVALNKGCDEGEIEKFVRKSARRYGYSIVSVRLREGTIPGAKGVYGQSDIVIDR